MDCHNFGFGTGYELFDDKQRLVDKNFNPFVPDIEGEVETTITDIASGKILEKHKQPMRSFVGGMIVAFMDGSRTSNDVCITNSGHTNYSTKGLILGRLVSCTIGTKRFELGGGNPSPEYTGGVVTASYPIQTLNGVEFEVAANLVVNGPSSGTSERNGCGIHVGRPYQYGSSTSSLVDGLLIAADIITPVSFTTHQSYTIQIKYVFRFPNSNSKTLTMNWFMNLIANLVGPYNFTTTSDDLVAKVNTSRAGTDVSLFRTFTYLSSTRARIEPGPDNTVPAGINNTKLTEWPGGGIAHVLNQVNNNFPAVNITYQSASGIEYIGNTARCVCYTTWQNITQNPVTVKEAGLIVNENRTDSTITGINGTGEFLLARWLIGPVELLPGWSLKVYFQPQVTCG